MTNDAVHVAVDIAVYHAGSNAVYDAMDHAVFVVANNAVWLPVWQPEQAVFLAGVWALYGGDR